MFDADVPSVVFSSVMFGENEVNIQYMEIREQSRAASMARSITIQGDSIQEEMEELEALLAAIVDKGSLLIRNPPKRMRRSGLGVPPEVLIEMVESEDDFDEED